MDLRKLIGLRTYKEKLETELAAIVKPEDHERFSKLIKEFSARENYTEAMYLEAVIGLVARGASLPLDTVTTATGILEFCTKDGLAIQAYFRQRDALARKNLKR